MKISIPIGGSCLFVQIDNEFEIPVTNYLDKSKINYTSSFFTKADIIVDSISSSLDFVEMLKEANSKHGC